MEACDRILYEDTWFPTISRIREIADECRHRRLRSERARMVTPAGRSLVCPACHGARWVRRGGADPLNMRAGESGSRAQPCPGCTVDERHDAERETATIRRSGGVVDPMPPADVDLSNRTWPERMAALKGADGRIDMDRLYRLSRELRGLDPNVDERSAGVSGWQTIGGRSSAPPAPRPQIVAVTAGEDDDDVPF